MAVHGVEINRAIFCVKVREEIGRSNVGRGCVGEREEEKGKRNPRDGIVCMSKGEMEEGVGNAALIKTKILHGLGEGRRGD